MTTRPRPKSAPIAWTPALAIGAAAFAALCWIIRIPLPKPATPSAQTTATTATPSPEIPEDAIAKSEPWSPMIEGFERLRDKLPEQPVEMATNAAEPEQAAPAPAAPSAPPLSWRYRGMIEGPGGIAALVGTPVGQRFFFEGQRVADDTDPSAPLITITTITPKEIVIDRRGKEERIPFEQLPETSVGAIKALETRSMQ